MQISILFLASLEGRFLLSLPELILCRFHTSSFRERESSSVALMTFKFNFKQGRGEEGVGGRARRRYLYKILYEIFLHMDEGSIKTQYLNVVFTGVY